MAYQVLARKWRPQDFSGVVGQAPIVTALGNALVDRAIAQAYLFSGIRGIGKTSVARLLAKALNCERGPAANPCNECTTCAEITAGSDLDVIEVDAATYSKVEQIRELTESLKYGPARDRYKVVVLDEIHRLSRQAFDALLKIVEEPPPHLVFIFATTEVEAVPATVLSRCQEFHFRRVPSRELAQHLRQIAEQEEIEVSGAALRVIARAGEGSVRDAVALLDQLAIYGSGRISDEEAERVLGGLGSERFVDLLGAILGSESVRVTEIVADVEAEGWDPRQVYTQFLAYCRDALHLSLGGDLSEIDLAGEEVATLAQLATDTGYENLLRVLHQLLQSEGPVRHSEFGSLALEIALLRAAELPKLTRIEELLSGRPAAASEVAGATRSRGSSRSSPPARGPLPTKKVKSRTAGDAAATPSGSERPSRSAAGHSGAPEPEPQEPAPEMERPAPAPEADRTQSTPELERIASTPDPERIPTASESKRPPTRTKPKRAAPSATLRQDEPGDPAPEPPISDSVASGNSAPPPPEAEGSEVELDNGEGTGPAVAGGNDPVELFLERVGRARQSLAAHLGTSENIVFDDGELLIFAPAGDAWLDNALSRTRNRKILDESLVEVFGASARWRLVEGTGVQQAVVEPPEPAVDDLSGAADHPMVQTVLDVFGGKVESEDPTNSTSKD